MEAAEVYMRCRLIYEVQTYRYDVDAVSSKEKYCYIVTPLKLYLSAPVQPLIAIEIKSHFEKASFVTI